MFPQQSPEHFHIAAADAAAHIRGMGLKGSEISMDSMPELLSDLKLMGIDLTEVPGLQAYTSMMDGLGMDAITPTVTTASVTTPIQFLQNWLPGYVNVITAARNIDLLIGMTTSGSWEDEQIVQGLMEPTGTSVPYGDYSNVPLASWNVNFETRSVVRFEEGLQVSILEQRRAARMNTDSAGNKRQGAALALEIQRNSVGFNGYNNGTNKTYGFLNDPGLPAYVEVATGTGGYTWAQKTFLEIQQDILTAANTLLTQSQGTIDPMKVPTVLAVATASVGQLAKTSNYGISVLAWIKMTYPQMRIESAPELNAAHNSDNVFYLYAESVSGDGSTDDGRTWVQVVPAKSMLLGVQQKAKSFEEDYSNATAGAMCKRPYAVVRYFHI